MPIVEECSYRALDLAAAVEAYEGCVAGPVASLGEAIALLESETVAAAIVDCDAYDGDCCALVRLLSDRGMPIVFRASTGMPQQLADLHGRVTVLHKPVDPRLVLDSLINDIGSAGEP